MTAVRAAGLLALCGIGAASSVHAGQPLVVDDVAVVAPKTCQVEAWSRLAHDTREYWIQPACNFTGSLEFDVAGARARSDPGESTSLFQLQAKTVLFPRANGEWSFGAAAGAGRDTGAPHGSSAFQVYYAKALASWFPRRDLEMDFNLGAENDFNSGTFALAGVAVQYTIVSRVQLLAEAFRDEPGPAKYQVGVRGIVVPNRFEAYLSYGNRFAGPSDRWSAIVGIRLQSPAFLP
jgi:hypothetical protein